MDITQKRFHGWYIVGVCFVIFFIFSGFVTTVPWHIYHKTMMEETGQSRGQISIAMMASMPTLILVSLLIGWLVDRFGSKRPMLAGCLLSGAGMMLFLGPGLQPPREYRYTSCR